MSTRRRFLIGGVGAGLVVTTGGVLAWVGGGYTVPSSWPTPPLALSVKELCVVRAIVDAEHPGGAEGPGGLELGVDRAVDEELYSQPAGFRADFKAALQVLEHAPPLVGKAGRLSALAAPARVEALDALGRRGPDVIVQAVAGVRQMLAFLVYSDERSWQAIGYDGPWQKTPSPPASRARYLAATGSPS